MRNTLFIFGQLDDFDVDWLSRLGTTERIPAGSVLIREGEPIDAVYVVLDGAFAVSRRSPGWGVAEIGAGEMIGEMSFVDASPPSADVRATTDALVARIPREKLQERLDSDPGFASRFYRAVSMMLSQRLRDARGSQGGSGRRGDYDPDELDPNVMASITRAGERFDRMLRHLRGVE